MNLTVLIDISEVFVFEIIIILDIIFPHLLTLGTSDLVLSLLVEATHVRRPYHLGSLAYSGET